MSTQENWNPSTSSPAGSLDHAKISVKPGSGLESAKALARAFGLSSPALLGTLDPDLFLLRTCQDCLFPTAAEDGSTPGLDEWRETWPDSGMCVAGSVYELRTSEPVISESASSSWPTPRTITGGGESAERKKELGRTESGGGDLQATAEGWPTPASRDYRTPNLRSYQDRSGTMKGEQLQNFVEHNFASLPVPPIPGGPPSFESGQISRRRLNPRFVEWLMGFEPGWTEL